MSQLPPTDKNGEGMTTHDLIEIAARIFEGHEYVHLARDMRHFAFDGIPNVPVHPPVFAQSASASQTRHCVRCELTVPRVCEHSLCPQKQP